MTRRTRLNRCPGPSPLATESAKARPREGRDEEAGDGTTQVLHTWVTARVQVDIARYAFLTAPAGRRKR
jgi:hypothetical protein